VAAPASRSTQACRPSPPARRAPAASYRGADRRTDDPDGLVAADAPDRDRRARPALRERRIREVRPRAMVPDGGLTRSRYEEVFLRLVAGTAIRIGEDHYRPVKMRGWYHAVFVRLGEEGDEERVLSIDELLDPATVWLDGTAAG
jgi:hypothetical protein